MADEATTLKTWTVILIDGEKTVVTKLTAVSASHAEVDAMEACGPTARVVCVLFGSHEPVWPKWKRRG